MCVAWGVTEVVRYNWYWTKEAFGEAPRFLTWLRYSLFTFLYPLGVYVRARESGRMGRGAGGRGELSACFADSPIPSFCVFLPQSEITVNLQAVNYNAVLEAEHRASADTEYRDYTRHLTLFYQLVVYGLMSLYPISKLAKNGAHAPTSVHPSPRLPPPLLPPFTLGKSSPACTCTCLRSAESTWATSTRRRSRSPRPACSFPRPATAAARPLPPARRRWP